MPAIRLYQVSPTQWRRRIIYLIALYAVPLLAALIVVAAEPLALPVIAAVAWVVVRRRTRERRFRSVYLAPTATAIAVGVGVADVRLRVSAQLGNLVPRLARELSPAEESVRRWYGRRLEPVLRWLPDRVQRVTWAVLRRLEPAVSKLRRPKQDAAAGIVLTLATAYLTPDQRKYVDAVVKSKIPVTGLVEHWDLVGNRVKATWTPQQRPPRRVGAEEVLAALPKLAEWEFFVGSGAGGTDVVVSLKDDSPHIACSAGSGAGKSVLAQLIGVQVLARGGQVVILDRKGSHRWARGLANVRYCTQPAAMHDALVEAAKLADERNQRALDEPEDWNPGPRVFIIAEELNATLAQLRDHWDHVREKGQPKASPAIRALGELLYMGRSAKVNVFAVAQMLSARAVGGPEARENFGIRCLARYTANAWKMLTPEAAMPRASRTLGRWQVVVAGTATETQVAYLSAAQARQLAGVPASAKRPEGALTSDVTGDTGQTGDMIDPLAEAISLREAIDEGVIPWGTKDATKKRLKRARAERRPAPESVGKRGVQTDLYRRGDLIVWVEAETRPRSEEVRHDDRR